MDFVFLGGRLPIDLLNTVIARDLLGTRDDVASWAEAAGLASRRDLRAGGHEPADLRAFREGLRRGLLAWAAAGAPPATLLALLNHRLARDPVITEIRVKGRTVVTHERAGGGPLEGLYGAVARSAAELLATGDSRRLRKCANPACPLMFYDTSKAGRRRWCSMQTCGARAKVRAFYRRHRRRRRVTKRAGTPPPAATR